MFFGILIATLLILIATLLPVFRLEQWWVRVFDFPRLQILIAAIAVLAAVPVFLDSADPVNILIIVAVAASAAVQAWWILPYTFFFPKEVRSSRGENEQDIIRLLVANVLTSNRHSEGFIELVRVYSPDLVLTLESDQWWQERLDTLEPEYCHTMKCPLDNLYGMHLYSRLALSSGEIKYLVEEKVPSMHTLVTIPSGRKIRAHFLHPSPPVPNERNQSTERDAELITVARSVEEADVPVIVAGDLNDVAWSSTTRLFRKISGLLDPRIGRGMYNTFNAKYPFVRFPLDHLFHSDHFRVVSIRRLPKFGSDHFPMLFDLEFCEDRSGGDSGLSATDYDYGLAKEKSEQKDMKKEDVPEPEN